MGPVVSHLGLRSHGCGLYDLMLSLWALVVVGWIYSLLAAFIRHWNVMFSLYNSQNLASEVIMHPLLLPVIGISSSRLFPLGCSAHSLVTSACERRQQWSPFQSHRDHHNPFVFFESSTAFNFSFLSSCIYWHCLLQFFTKGLYGEINCYPISVQLDKQNSELLKYLK